LREVFAGGNAPTLTTAEIEELVAFLCALTDGFDPKTPRPTPYRRDARRGAE
jgi:hypothetical protein